MSRRRVWCVLEVDVEIERDALGNVRETPVAEPVVLGSTHDHATAERLLGVLAFDKSGKSMVRSSVTAAPVEVIDAVEAVSDVDRVLSMVD